MEPNEPKTTRPDFVRCQYAPSGVRCKLSPQVLVTTDSTLEDLKRFTVCGACLPLLKRRNPTLDLKYTRITPALVASWEAPTIEELRTKLAAIRDETVGDDSQQDYAAAARELLARKVNMLVELVGLLINRLDEGDPR
jgi:hypothetical protein